MVNPLLSVYVWAACGIAMVGLLAFEWRRWRRDERERHEVDDELKAAVRAETDPLEALWELSAREPVR
jgi:hypothetical protein